MERLTKGKLHKGNLTIIGSSTAAGGTFDKVNIVGEGTIDGDVNCNSLRCMGTLEMDGHLKSKRIKILGTCSFSGKIEADAIKISGTVSVGGDIRLKALRCSGTIETRGNLHSDQVELQGELETQGDCEADVFKARGIFNIGGLLNAGSLDIKLYRDCHAKEIGGERIRVSRASMLNPFNFFFKPSPHAILSVSVIEGDDIYLENTIAQVVRGNHVVIGSGCEIGLVEYTRHFEQSQGTAVKEKRKV